jgi:hypothetical protein
MQDTDSGFLTAFPIWSKIWRIARCPVGKPLIEALRRPWFASCCFACKRNDPRHAGQFPDTFYVAGGEVIDCPPRSICLSVQRLTEGIGKPVGAVAVQIRVFQPIEPDKAITPAFINARSRGGYILNGVQPGAQHSAVGPDPSQVTRPQSPIRAKFIKDFQC